MCTQKFDLCKMSHRPQAKCRQIELSLKTKIDLLRAAELVPKLNQKQLAEKFGIGLSTVSDILKKKDEYCVEYEKNASSGKMRCKTEGELPRAERIHMDMVLTCLLFVCFL